MVISAYQVNNVLRVYHDQIRLGKASSRQSNNLITSPDPVNISTMEKQKALIDQIASSIADKINRSDTRNGIGKEEMKKIESEFNVQLDVYRNDSSDLIYKLIDAYGETIKLLTIEDIENSENFDIN